MGGGTPRTESALADQLFAAGGPSAPHEDLYLVVRSPGVAATDPAYRAAVGDMIGRLARRDRCVGSAGARRAGRIRTLAPAEAGLISADGTSVRIVASDRG